MRTLRRGNTPHLLQVLLQQRNDLGAAKVVHSDLHGANAQAQPWLERLVEQPYDENTR